MLTLKHIDRLYVDDPASHWDAARHAGLECPFDVFVQVFHEPFGARNAPVTLATVDWLTVVWTQEHLSGAELRQVYVARCFELGLDEARTLARENGVYDERPEVMSAWERQRTWAVPPVLIAARISDVEHRRDLLVGRTRLGNLLGLLDRGDISESHRHQIWLGQPCIDANNS